MSRQTHLFLSDEAYDGLVAQARKVGFVRGVERSKGVGPYMRALLELNPTGPEWRDTRPEWASALDIPNLEEGQLPIWDKGDARILRRFGGSVILDRAAILAYDLGIVKSNTPGLRGRGDRFSVPALVSQFWEAVGLKWLTPAQMPHNTYKTKLHKHWPEIEW
jgi:hypothetical protein